MQLQGDNNNGAIAAICRPRMLPVAIQRAQDRRSATFLAVNERDRINSDDPWQGSIDCNANSDWIRSRTFSVPLQGVASPMGGANGQRPSSIGRLAAAWPAERQTVDGFRLAAGCRRTTVSSSTLNSANHQFIATTSACLSVASPSPRDSERRHKQSLRHLLETNNSYTNLVAVGSVETAPRNVIAARLSASKASAASSHSSSVAVATACARSGLGSGRIGRAKSNCRSLGDMDRHKQMADSSLDLSYIGSNGGSQGSLIASPGSSPCLPVSQACLSLTSRSRGSSPCLPASQGSRTTMKPSRILPPGSFINSKLEQHKIQDRKHQSINKDFKDLIGLKKSQDPLHEDQSDSSPPRRDCPDSSTPQDRAEGCPQDRRIVRSKLPIGQLQKGRIPTRETLTGSDPGLPPLKILPTTYARLHVDDPPTLTKNTGKGIPCRKPVSKKDPDVARIAHPILTRTTSLRSHAVVSKATRTPTTSSAPSSPTTSTPNAGGLDANGLARFEVVAPSSTTVVDPVNENCSADAILVTSDPGSSNPVKIVTANGPIGDAIATSTSDGVVGGSCSKGPLPASSSPPVRYAGNAKPRPSSNKTLNSPRRSGSTPPHPRKPQHARSACGTVQQVRQVATPRALPRVPPQAPLAVGPSAAGGRPLRNVAANASQAASLNSTAATNASASSDAQARDPGTQSINMDRSLNVAAGSPVCTTSTTVSGVSVVPPVIQVEDADDGVVDANKECPERSNSKLAVPVVVDGAARVLAHAASKELLASLERERIRIRNGSGFGLDGAAMLDDYERDIEMFLEQTTTTCVAAVGPDAGSAARQMLSDDENQGQKCQWSEETAGSAAGSAEGGGDGRTPSQDVRQNPFVRIIDQADAVKLTAEASGAVTPHRSLSLPKSFLSSKYGLTGLKAAFPRRTGGADRCATGQVADDSNVLPAMEIGGGERRPPLGASLAPEVLRQHGGSMSRIGRRGKSTSSPVLDIRSHSAWDLGRPWSQYSDDGAGSVVMMEASSSASIAVSDDPCSAKDDDRVGGRPQVATSDAAAINETGQVSAGGQERPLRRFRKSFSLRLSRRCSQEDHEGESSGGDGGEQQTSPKFRFGPLVWRGSGKKGNKAARNAKCNSGDSGVQMELSSPVSLSEDTGSGGVVGSARKSVVRRTQSDLGGNAVITAALDTQWSDSSTTPLPLAPAVEEERDECPASHQSRSRKLTRYVAKAYLRRSASQPVVLNSESAPQDCADANSDDDAGLCLTDDDMSDADNSAEQDSGNGVAGLESGKSLLAIALWEHKGVEQEELNLQPADIVHVMNASSQEWWWACKGTQYGWVPASYVQLCENPGAALSEMTHTSISSKSVRANVIHELITAEREYVKLMNDLVEGYLIPMRSRSDLFDEQQVDAIFGNLEALFEFQKKFLVDLELCLNWNSLEDSVIGDCFIQSRQNFHIYSTYCNNQDRSVNEMQRLSCDLRYARFFEACRLLRRMIRLPLEAFLLSPVQKICKYPLQLAELVKHTPDNHPDHVRVTHALESMRAVAFSVNESKRRSEMQQQLISWQRTVDNWQGSDIHACNRQLVRQGELFKVSSSGWMRDVIMFLFDKELVLCKKELMKRGTLVFKDRLLLEECIIVDVFDGRDSQLNVSVRNAFKMHCLRRDKWLLFSARSHQDKCHWLQSLQQIQHQRDLLSSGSHVSQHHQPAYRNHKTAAKRSKGKYNPALNLTLEEAQMTLQGRDLPLRTSKMSK